MKFSFRILNLLVAAALAASTLSLPAESVSANSTPQTLPFSQNWSNTGLIAYNDNWDNVPGIVGYRGDNLVSTTEVDPQTVLAADSPGVVDVIRNLTNTTSTDGGVGEFEIANPVVGLQGSVTADAPYLLIHLDTTGLENIQVSYNVRDIDTTSDDAAQQVALHYRVGASGDFTNLPGGYIADATTGGAATLVTPVSVALPAAANNQPVVQLRIMTTNASGNDEWVGIDDIAVTGTAAADPAPFVSGTVPAHNATGVSVGADLDITFSEPVSAPDAAFTIACTTSGAHTFARSTGNDTVFTLNPDANFTEGEFCTVSVLAAQVTDLDTVDPYDSMPADYAFTFLTYTSDAAPVVVNVLPLNNATGVSINANLSVGFSEPVTASPGFFNISCASSGVHTGVASTSDSTVYTIDPDVNFAPGEVCTVTLENTLITDQDALPNPMPADYTWTFTTTYCDASFTPVYAIQGSGASAAITGPVTTQGVVVGDFEGPSPALRGYYIQDAAGDGNPFTSDGIFIYNNSDSNNVSLGQLVRVTGTAGEYQGQTQITAASLTQCGADASVAPTDISLPFASADYPERYEGMLVRFPDLLYVTEHYLLGRFGQVTLSSGGRLMQPTGQVAPGAAALALQAQNDLNRILLDDNTNDQNSNSIAFAQGGEPLSAGNTLRIGNSAVGIVGVMTYTWGGNSASPNAYRVRPINALGGGYPDFQEITNPRPYDAVWLTGRLRVASMNLLNYFNTFGSTACTLGVGGASTDCRGADNQTEFDRQWPKLVDAILATGAHVVGLVELENDGYGATSALQDLVNRLNAATAPGTFAFIDADALTGQVNALGSDAIKVGLIYRPAAVTPVGATAVLNSTAFVNGGDASARNRPALAQAFAENATGSRFIVVVNHLKSKGSACDAPDAGDGQGNCNLVRTNAANLLTTWLAGNPTGTGDPDVLITGDLNAYAMEDPITAIQGAGYTNLIAQYNGASAYSYVFDGQSGYLDHALASAGLALQVTGVVEHHINADEPIVLDYNTEYKTAGQLVSLYTALKFRASDHDPVVVGLNLNTDPVANDLSLSTNEEVPVGSLLAGSDADGDPLTFTLGSGPANGTLVLNADNTFTYTPALDYFGLDGFTFTVSDGRGGSDTGTVSITVTPINDNPVADELSFTIEENTVLNASVTASDVDGDTLTYGISSGPTDGLLSLDPATGAFTYTPLADWQGTASFIFFVSDGNSGWDSATVSIHVIEPNVSPVAGDQSLPTDEDTPLTGTLTATDGNNDPLTYTQATGPAHGTLLLDGATGAFTYIPNADYHGPDSFTFTVADGRGGTDTGTVSITVHPINDAPVAGDQSIGTDEDTPLTGTLSAADADGDALTYAQATAPAHGSVSITAATGAFTYTPALDYFGPDSFSFAVSDGHGGTDTGTVTLTVAAVNDAPAAGNLSLSVDEDGVLTGTLTASDVDSTVFTYVQLTGPAHGTLLLDGATGDFTYTPAADYFGPDSFTFTVSDGYLTDTGTVSITVQAINDAPVANDQSLSTNEDAPLTGTLSAADADDDALTYAQGTAPEHGSLSITPATGSFTYTPALDHFGPDSFTFTVSDGHGGSDTGTITITVGAVNDPPVATDQTLSTNEDTPLTGTLTASDVDSTVFTYAQGTAPAHGSLSITPATGAFTYTPAANYHGPDSFTFTASDGSGGTDTGLVTITIYSINDAPVANDLSRSIDEDMPLTGMLTATDADGDALTYTQTTGPAHGSLSITAANGAFTYTPAADYHGPDSFTFTVSDGHGGSDTGAVSITVNPVNDAPLADNRNYETNEDTPYSGTLTATDADGDALNYATLYPPLHGTLSLTPATGAFTYTPAANWQGMDVFTFTVSDGHGGGDSGTIAINVLPVNDAPVAGDLTRSTNEDVPLTGTLPASDVDGDALTYAQAVAPLHGSLSINANTGSFTYTPALDWHGADTFSFTVSDGQVSDGGTVNITVNPVNDAPVAGDQALSVDEDGVLNGTLTASDVDSTVFTYAQFSGPAHGMLSITAATGAFTYTPAANWHGTDSFTFTVSDGAAEDTGTVTITVNPLNDAPEAGDQDLSTDEDTPLTGTLNATDADGDALTYAQATGPAHGTLSITAGTGAFTYTPNLNFNSSDSFTFAVSDGHGGTDTGTVTITVAAVNDAPTAGNQSLGVDEDGVLTGTLTALDPDSAELTYAQASGPAHGTLLLDGATGDFTYTPAADFNGEDSFTFTASDGELSGTGTVTITVQAINDAPVAGNPSLETDEDGVLTGTLPASDVDGDALSYAQASGPAHGTLEINAGTGAFTYMPDPDWHGDDGFSFAVNDGQGGSDTGVISITVHPLNDAPLAPDLPDAEWLAGFESSLAIDPFTDADGDPLIYTVTLADGSALPAWLSFDDGALTFSGAPARDDVGEYAITVSVDDGQGGTAEASFTLRVVRFQYKIFLPVIAR
ncbi:MAG: ExeM/NucH family extracellular endonuclease [Chloroflexi bacterium]|nr:ExeM/NucH family extracellular endonuclease [Chloroflexota bacterium]